MMVIKTCLLLAAFLPWVSTLCAKIGAPGFDNENPRPWLAGLSGWRARANAAQANAFEALPFFYAAVLMALWSGADQARLGTLLVAWLVLRLAYFLAYVAGKGSLRSLVWFAAVAVNIWILFLPAVS